MSQTSQPDLPFSQACENNQQPIFEVLQRAFVHSTRVLEIGSGTGQHSVYMAPRLPQLVWQTSDLPIHHPGIRAWHAARPADNLRTPIKFDLRSSTWPDAEADAVFTSNTAHIVAWPLVERMLQLVGANLPKDGVFAIYGPFNYGGQFTSDSNRAFDGWLRERDAQSGIRDFEAVLECAAKHGLKLLEDNAMPANNRLLVLSRSSQ